MPGGHDWHGCRPPCDARPALTARHTTSQSGFTLLEFIVVLMILGFLVHLSIGTIKGPDEKQQIRQATLKLAGLIRLASDHASLNSQYVGLQINRHSYFFVIRTGTEWTRLKDRLLRSVTLQQPLRLEFTNRQNTPLPTVNTHGADNTPNILIAGSGELTPFAVRIIGNTNTPFYEITGGFSGQINIRENTDQ